MMRCCQSGASPPFCTGSDLDAARGIMLSSVLGALLWSLPILLHGLLP